MSMTDQDYGPERKIRTGRWRGEYLDAFGHRGRIELALEEEGGEVRGRYELTFRTEDAPEKVAGEFRGRIEAGRVSFEAPVEARKAEQRPPETARFEAQLSPAGSFAGQAMFGLVSNVGTANFGGGVWIAWRFEEPRG
ncbi:MAG TPA: hypothetical protein VFH81_01240 [Actinomycetota bacterium]|nr:hypothetical protein [Actinomycetota bacterium]